MIIGRARFRKFLYLATVFGGLSFASYAHAQDITLPGSADVGRIPGPDINPPVLSEDLEAEAPPRQAVAPAPPGMENLRFVLQSLTVSNMTAYSPQQIAPLFDEYVGEEISVATIFDVMARIQQKYLDDGFALTKVVIPNQNIQNGNVQLAVIEGYVADVEIDKAVLDSTVIDHAASIIREMKPLDVKKLERVMLIINDLPDLNVSAIIARPKDETTAQEGAVRLVIQKNPEKEKVASVSIDNHGSVFSGPWESTANAYLFHVGENYSQLSITGSGTVPLEEQKAGSAVYKLPLFGASGTELSLFASRASTEPGSSLSLLDIKGASYSAGVGISYPVIRQRDMTLRVDAGFEWKDSRTKILGEELYDDRIRTVKTGFNFNFTDGWAGYNLMDVHYIQGLDIFGVRESGSPDLSRADGRSDFKKFEFMAGRLQPLPGGFEMLALINGQYSYDPLLSSEEFGFGGGQIGRGYDSSEITGDRGISFSLELRRSFPARVYNTVIAVQPYAFYDTGKVWNIDEGAEDNISATSAGAGVRMDLGNQWAVDFNLAVPLTKSADNEPKYQNDLGARALFSLTKRF